MSAGALDQVLLDALQEGVVVVSTEGRVIGANAAAGRIMGVTPERLVAGDHRSRGWTYVHEDGRPMALADIPISRCLRTGVTVTGERVGALDQSGGLTWLSVDAHPLADGRGIVACFADITEEVQAQRRLQVSDTRARALASAARALHDELDMTRLLAVIAREARTIIGADAAAVMRGNATDGMTVEAGVGNARSDVGRHWPPGAGMGGMAATTGETVVTLDYEHLVRPPVSMSAHALQTGIAVPMRWDGAIRAVLFAGFTRDRPIVDEERVLLESFAGAAAAACRNASAAAGLVQAARTDGLTGCLNHAAFQEGLRHELARAERTGGDVAVLLVDLDDFKAVNESRGHLAGDEMLRHVGQALSRAVRPYDPVARYGGDEFAVICADADESAAREVALRLVAELDPVAEATVGVAVHKPDERPEAVIGAADRALLWGKETGGRRGGVVLASDVPEGFRPVAQPPAVTAAEFPSVADARERDERLHKRTRQLALANALGARLGGMTEVREIEEAIVDELSRAFGYYLCAVVRVREDGVVHASAVRGDEFARLGVQRWTQPVEVGLIGRALRECRVVLVNDVRADESFACTSETRHVQAELVAPIVVDGAPWGVINIEEVVMGAFDEEDVRLVRTIADQAGAALRGALLYQRLERAYLGTAEALAAALEAKDAYTAEHAASIVAAAQACGRTLGLDEAALRDLRYGAIFHDIGKIAVPEALLHKAGPLDDDEWAVVQGHTVAGEQILAPIEFLSDVLPLVRHEHERWDGGGYPDGLAGEAIPLGARIILVCDAFHAMTTDRPYRAAMSIETALAELHAHAGTQFDPAVVAAFVAEGVEQVAARTMPR